ncbi:hypothetical protein BGZ80_011469 [Entomortierella chlamydospora]|uniref:Uncharacterized protein n=1 Tax=Entomortierella chlamydospora TaxID=101097 RepID=A0A9P6MUE2_9FUNG|nr:hypothetical protein BGZ80_011469 [Entomortierella chlamydospora]
MDEQGSAKLHSAKNWFMHILMDYGRTNNLEDLLRQKYFSLHLDEKRAALTSTLAARVRNGKVLSVLDGLDEVVTDIQTDDGDPTGMFLKHLLQQTHVIITSRPSGVDTSILPKLDLELETIGFSQENVRNYLANVLKPEAARGIQDFIQRTPLLQSLVNIPVQLDVICYSWDSLPSNEHSLTMTGLYQTMVGKLWRKDGIRLQKSTDGEKLTLPQISRLRPYQIGSLMANEIEYLSYLAFVGMRENHQIEFNETALLDAIEELDQCRKKSNKCPLPFQLLDKLKQTSFLHTVDGGVDAGNNTSQCSWHFLHLTFQEYFAATWLAQHLRSDHSNSIGCSTLTMTVGETKAFIAKHKYNPRYEIIWWMVSGQLEGEALGLFLDLLQETPRDLIGGQHQRLLAGCLKEARPKLNDEVTAELETELMQWLHFERMLYSDDGAESILGRQSVFPEELLVRCLSQTKAAQKYAIKALRDRSIVSESTIVTLIGALEDHDSYTRYSSVRVLCAQLVLPGSAILLLVTALQDKDSHVRRSAVIALSARSTLSETSILALISVLDNRDPDVRRSAAKVLGAQSTSSESAALALINTLRGQDEDARSSAIQALISQSTLPNSVISTLTYALSDNNRHVRISAAQVLRVQSTLSESATLAMIEALKNEIYLDIMELMSEALCSQSALPGSNILALIRVLKNRVPDVRISAVKVLGAQSALSESAALALTDILRDEDEDEYVRSSATQALISQSTLPDSAISTLTYALSDNNRHVRISAAQVLRVQSALSESATLTMIEAWKNEIYRNIMELLSKALCSQSTLPDYAISTLTYALSVNNRRVRKSAAQVLNAQSTLSEFTIPTLTSSLRGKDEVVLSAQSILSKPATMAIIEALKNENPGDIRFLIAGKDLDTLVSLSTKPESIVQALVSALYDSDWKIKSLAVQALGEQSTLPEPAIRALIPFLRHKAFRESVIGVLDKHHISMCMAIPKLSVVDIGMLYKSYLFRYSCGGPLALYVQDDQLWFYTGRGPGHTDPLSSEKIKEIVSAFRGVQNDAGIHSISYV